MEIRARERTFDGAYGRAAIGCLGFALTVLRLFDKHFYRSMTPRAAYHHFSLQLIIPSYHIVGVLYVILSVMLTMFSYLRQRNSKHDFADCRTTESPASSQVLSTKGQEGTRVFGRQFITAGWIVVGVTAVVAAVEISLLVLILTV